MRRVRVPHPFSVLRKGAGFDFTYFLLVSRPPQPFNPHLTVQLLIPAMHCYSLHNLILASYSPSCISNAVLAESFPRLRVISVDSVYPDPVGASPR